MCNLYSLTKAPAAIVALIRAMGGPVVVFPDGVPNVEPRDVRISERAPILRAGQGAGAGGEGVESEGAEGEAGGGIALVLRRWSWPGPGGKPVFNFRADGRRFPPASRCVIPADAFYEFTAPADPRQKTKDRWRFDWPGHDWFGIAGIVRAHGQVGEAFTMLTCPPGPDVAPIHDRQIVLLSPSDALRWLDPAVPAEALTRPLPAGTLRVARG